MLALYSVQQDDLTYDEQDHLNYGISILKGNSDKIQPGADFNTTMPISALNAIPRAVEQVLDPSLHKNDFGESDTKTGRYITILFTLFLLTYVYLFARSLAGTAAGNLAIFIAAVDPNILAHGRLVTTDMFSALAFMATLYHLYTWTYKNKQAHFYYWCLAIAIAQCCKINAVLLYPISLIILIERAITLKPFGQWKSLLSRLILFILLQLLVINAAFLFNGTGSALADYHFQSNFFKSLQSSFWGSIPLPLPVSFIQTFDLTQFERESFTGTAQNYLWGELRYKSGFWNYYLICFAVKTPLLLQIAFVGAIIVWIKNKRFDRVHFLFLLLPILITVLLLSTSSVQNGYRYLLPVLIVGIVFLGGTINTLLQRITTTQLILLAGLYLWPLVSSANNFLAYTSEWIWPKKNAWKYVADSNLNWGQRDKKIQQYIKENPAVIVDPSGPVSGKVLVDINKFTGIIETERYKWLRDKYEPVEVVEGCFLLFEIP